MSDDAGVRTPGAGEVDRYLDDMFDRLARTGAAGRRALAEAEDHLYAAAADGIASGLSTVDAERAAIRRFGQPGLIAAAVRRSNRGRRLAGMLSGAWLLAGIAVTVVGLSYVVNAVGIAILLRIRPKAFSICEPRANPWPIVADCSQSTNIMQQRAIAGAVILLVAVLVFLARRVLTRSSRLPAAGRAFPWLAAALFAAMSAVLYADMVVYHFMLGGKRAPGIPLSVQASGVALVTAFAIACWGAVRLIIHRRSYPISGREDMSGMCADQERRT